jgi:hypothetical protein
MIQTKTFHSIIALFAITIMALGAGNWVLQPDKALTWTIGMLAMPFIWIFVAWTLRKRPLGEYGNAERKFFILSVFSVGVILVLAMIMRLVDSTTSFSFAGIERMWGIALGLFLLGMGNIVPKILSPLTVKGCSSVEHQASQRFAGWMFVLAGFVQTLLFVFFPIKQAGSFALLVLVTVLILVSLRYLWAMTRGNNSS